MDTMTVQINEHRSGDHWTLRWSTARRSECGRRFGSAAEALKYVRQVGALHAKAGRSTAIVVHWSAETRLGLAAVRALQEDT